MKYNEYSQLRDLLDENGLTIEEYMQDPQLYEGLLGNAGAKVLGLLQKGMTSLISKGISKNHIQKLNQSANKIVKIVEDKLAYKKDDKGEETEGVIQSIEKNVEAYKEQWKAKNKIDEIPEEKIQQLDNKKNKEIAKYINGVVSTYSDKVKSSIKNKKGIDDKDREELENYWAQLMTKIEVDVSGKLIEKGILEDDDAFAVLKNMMNYRMRGAGEEATPTSPKLPEVGKEYLYFGNAARDKETGNYVGVIEVKIKKVDKTNIYYTDEHNKTVSTPITNADKFKPKK